MSGYFSRSLRLLPVLALILLVCAGCGSGGGDTGPLSELPKGAQDALDQRIKGDTNTQNYRVVTAEQSGSNWCIVFGSPLKGSVGGQTFSYDYAVIQPQGGGWNAILVEDHQDGLALSIFGCEGVYKK